LLLLSLLVCTANPSLAQEKSTRTLASGKASSLEDSVESGIAAQEPIPLTLIDAIHRGLKSNLAVISGDLDARIAEAEKLRDLSDLLPKVNGQLSSMSQQVNLAAYGFTGFAGISQVIGPFSLVDARATLSQPIVDMQRIHNLRESKENIKAVALSNQSTREMVVLTVMDLYFRTVSAASRVNAVEAQVVSAEALNKRAADLKSAGVVPGIDVLRAQVELQSVQQRRIQAKNDLSREKLNLARAIGLPLAQEFTIADSLPGGASPEISLSELFERAYANRPEVKASDARLRAAEEAVKAAKAENLPTVHFDANYGVIGPRPNDSHGTYAVAGAVQFPIFNSRSKSDTMEKEALLHQRQAQMDSLHGRVELEVREALLELQSSEEQYKVAQSALTLVREQLTQAQDRFAAGVANNLEVVQAQEALALADENLIRSLYGFNAARAALAHATGVTEKSVEEVFGRDKRP
jgi:outer membrane protein TolC